MLVTVRGMQKIRAIYTRGCIGVDRGLRGLRARCTKSTCVCVRERASDYSMALAKYEGGVKSHKDLFSTLGERISSVRAGVLISGVMLSTSCQYRMRISGSSGRRVD